MDDTLVERLTERARWWGWPDEESGDSALHMESKARIEALNRECDERVKAHQIAFNQAMANGEAAIKARAEAAEARSKALEEAAKVADALRWSETHWHPAATAAAQIIATAIRNLIENKAGTLG